MFCEFKRMNCRRLRLFGFGFAVWEMTQNSAWVCVTELFLVVPLLCTPFTQQPQWLCSSLSQPPNVRASGGLSPGRSTAERNRMQRLRCRPAGVSANRWGNNAGAGTPKLWLTWKLFASLSPAISLQLFSFHDRASRARRNDSGDWRDSVKEVGCSPARRCYWAIFA